MISTQIMKASGGSGLTGWDSWNGGSDGDDFVFDTSSIAYITMGALSDSHCILSYMDGGSSYYGKAKVIGVSGTTITAGSEYTFKSAAMHGCAVGALTSTAAIFAYCDAGTSYAGKGRACAINTGTKTIAYGSEFEFDSEAIGSSMVVARISDTQALCVYRVWFPGTSNSEGRACVLTTSATAGTPATFDIGNVSIVDVCMLSSTAFIISYISNGLGRIIYGAISGTTVTFPVSNQYLESNSIAMGGISIAMLSSTKAIACFSTDYIKARVLTVSGTTITKGGTVVLAPTKGLYPKVAKISETQAMCLYKSYNSPFYGIGCVVTAEASTPTKKSIVTFNAAETNYIAAAQIAADKIAVAFSDYAAAPYEGTVKILYGA